MVVGTLGPSRIRPLSRCRSTQESDAVGRDVAAVIEPGGFLPPRPSVDDADVNYGSSWFVPTLRYLFPLVTTSLRLRRSMSMSGRRHLARYAAKSSDQVAR